MIQRHKIHTAPHLHGDSQGYRGGAHRDGGDNVRGVEGGRRCDGEGEDGREEKEEGEM